MATRKRKSRKRRPRAAAARRRSTAPRVIYRRARRRRNPAGMRSILRNAPAFATAAAVGAVVGTGGVIAARGVRSLTGRAPGTVIGSLIEAGIGIAGGMALAAFVGDRVGAQFAQGALMAPVMTTVQQLNIPRISDTLGDDGFIIGGDTGLGLVSAYPDEALADVYDYDGMSGYVPGADNMAGYVPGLMA